MMDEEEEETEGGIERGDICLPIKKYMLSYAYIHTELELYISPRLAYARDSRESSLCSAIRRYARVYSMKRYEEKIEDSSRETSCTW